MEIPGAAIPDQRASQPWRLVLTILIVSGGATLFVIGAGLLAAARMAPEIVRLLPQPGLFIVGTLVIGVLGILVGLSGLVFGWGTPSGRPLSPGSHRAVLISTVVPFAVTIIASVAVVAAGPDMESDRTPIFLVGGLGLYVALLIMTYVQGVRTGLMTVESLGLRPQLIRRGLIWGVAGSGMTVAVGALNELLLRIFGLPQPQHETFEWLRGLPDSHFFAVAFAGAVVAPIAEELFFRGYVFNGYLAEKGLRTAFIGSAAIFAIVHVFPTLLLGIFFMGLVLAFAYQRSGTIIAPVLAHLINNSLAFISLYAMLHV